MYSLQTTDMPGKPAAGIAAPDTRTRRIGRELPPFRPEPDSVRRAHIGQIAVDLRAYGRQHCAQLTPNATVAHLIVPITGSAVAVSHQDSRQLTSGVALLLTKRQRTDFVWAANSLSLVLHFPTSLLQQTVAASFPEPRRLAGASQTLALEGAEAGLATLLQRALRIVEGNVTTADPATDRQLAQALVDGLRAANEDEFFPVSKSLQRASDFLMANPDSRCSPDQLAGIAGVTLPTLQRNVKTCLGIPLSKFVEQVRLSWVRTKLKSPMESRSMARLAEACGYKTPATLARSYQRLFGETPTQTRARAFAVMSD